MKDTGSESNHQMNWSMIFVLMWMILPLDCGVKEDLEVLAKIKLNENEKNQKR